MSLAKLFVFAMLATVAIFATLRVTQTRHDPLPSNSGWHRTVNEPSAVLISVQSKNLKNLGAAKFLVASRELADPSFAETVILLVHYDAGGVVGLIVNRRTKLPVSRVFDQLKAAKDRSDPVYFGGPVEIPAVFGLLQSKAKPEGAEAVLDGVYLITSKKLFEKVLADRPEAGGFHVYLGYAGWNEDQLQNEIKLGMWFIFPADTRTIFNANPDTLWRDLIKQTELKMARNEAGAK